MKSYLLASLTVLLACCFVGTTFAAERPVRAKKKC